MKKLILVCALSSFYLGSFAQSDSSHKKTDYDNKNDNTHKDCVFKMKDGKMMMMVDGKKVPMDKQMTTKNGSVVMTDGTVKMKDGKTVKMKDGDCLNSSDKIVAMDSYQIKGDSVK